MQRLNQGVSDDAIESAIEEITRDRSALHPIIANREVHHLLKEGVRIPITNKDGEEEMEVLQVIDWNHPDQNDFFPASQFWITGRPGPMHQPWELAELSRHFQTIVSLEEVDRRSIVKAGIEHIQLPSREFYGLTFSQMVELNRALDAFGNAQRRLSGGPPYLFHCHYGRGRTCLALASRLVWGELAAFPHCGR